MYKQHGVPVKRASWWRRSAATSRATSRRARAGPDAADSSTSAPSTAYAGDLLAGRHHGLGHAEVDQRLVGEVRERFPDMTLGLHLHDTRGMGIANAYAGLEMGVAISTRPSPGWAAARSPRTRARRATSAPRTWCSLRRDGHRDRHRPRRADRAARLAEDIVGHPLPGTVKMGGSLKALRETHNAARVN